MQSRAQVMLDFVKRCWHTYRWLSLGALCIILVGTSSAVYVVMASHTSHPPTTSAYSSGTADHTPSQATNTPAHGGTTTTASATPTIASATPSGTATDTVAPVVPTPTLTPSPPQGSHLVYDDEFNGSSLSATWVAWNRPGDSSNGESECYTPRPANVAVGGGNLILTAKVDPSCASYTYTSGGIQWATKSFTYGTFEYRAKFAGGRGTWPAIWLLGAKCQADQITNSGNNCNWPNPGSDEIDITEVFTGDVTYPKQNLITSGGTQTCTPLTSDVSQNWHTYDLVWQPGSLVWKIDGTVTCTFTAYVPNTPMFPIINVALGGNGGGPIDNSTLPQTMYVDYVRLYQ